MNLFDYYIIDEPEELEADMLLNPVWLDWTHWQAMIPVDQGPGVITMETYDAQGMLLGTDTVELVPFDWH